MNGWARLWLVLSLLVGAFGAMIGYNNDSQYGGPYSYNQNIGKVAADNEFWRQAHAEASLKHCEWPTATTTADYEGMSVGYSVKCLSTERYNNAVIGFVIPGALMAAIGMTLGWIFQGFKRTIK